MQLFVKGHWQVPLIGGAPVRPRPSLSLLPTVERPPGDRDLADVLSRPAREGLDRLPQRAAEGRQRVVHAGRLARVHGAGE